MDNYYPGLASALAAQDEVGDEVTSGSADEGESCVSFLMVVIILR